MGDLAETVSLVWPEADDHGRDDPGLAEAVDAMLAAGRTQAPAVFASLLDRLDPSGRFALIKLVTGGLRIGVSARLAKQALADLGGGLGVTDPISGSVVLSMK